MPTTVDVSSPHTDGGDNISTPANPVYANSHASMLSDPSSTNTSPATMKALLDHGLLTALVSALITPTPYGADGEHEGDIQLEANILR